MKKWKVFSAAVLSAAMLAAPMTAMADDAYRVCFVARASADTFAAWLTNEMKKAADQYDDIELTCVSGEADDAEMAKQLEDCITKQYDYVIVQSNNNAAQAPYVKAIADAGIPVVTTNPTTHQADLDGETGDPEVDNAVMAGTGTVDADPVAQAAVGAKRAVEEVPENANVVVFRGPSGNYHAEKRREAWDTYFFDVRDDVNILYERKNKRIEENYLLFTDCEEEAVCIAFKVEGQELVPVPNTSIFTYFPTDKESHQSFYIHAPFDTTPARDNIVEDSERNQRFVRNICDGIQMAFCWMRSA